MDPSGLGIELEDEQAEQDEDDEEDAMVGVMRQLGAFCACMQTPLLPLQLAKATMSGSPKNIAAARPRCLYVAADLEMRLLDFSAIGFCSHHLTIDHS